MEFLLALVLLAEPRAPLKKQLSPVADQAGFQRAEKLAEVMMAAKTYDGRFDVRFDKQIGRVVVSLFGRAPTPVQARARVDATVAALATLGDPDITIVYFYDGAGPGAEGYELLRRQGGEFIERGPPKRNGIGAVVP